MKRYARFIGVDEHFYFRRYLDNRVFVSLANGDIVVYNREGSKYRSTVTLKLKSVDVLAVWRIFLFKFC